LRFQLSTFKFVLTPFITALLLSAAARDGSAGAQEAAGGGSGPGRVAVTLGAVDKEGRPFEGLRPEDLRVTVEGTEQKVASLTRAEGVPLRVAFLLDASASQERVIPVAQDVSAKLAVMLLRPGVDEVAVVSFSGDPTLVQDLTGDPEALRRAFASVEFVPPKGLTAGGVVVGPRRQPLPDPRAISTAVWDSLVFVCDNVFARAKPGRRAVVLFTDGVDTASRTKLDKAVERLARAGVAVYSIGFADTFSFDEVEQGGLRKVSERTGGRALFPRKWEDIPAAFQQVGYGLLSSYTLELTPQLLKGAGKASRLRFEVVNPELRKRGLQLAYPQSVYDGPPPARR
jgi:Ca-activated chloride channel homolog